MPILLTYSLFLVAAIHSAVTYANEPVIVAERPPSILTACMQRAWMRPDGPSMKNWTTLGATAATKHTDRNMVERLRG